MRFRNRYVLLTDILLIIVAVMGSYVLRLELLEDFLRYYWQGALWWMGIALIVKPLVYYFFGLYRRLWVYASISELKLIAAAVTTSSLLVAAITLSLYSFQVFGPGFSRSALAIDWLLSLVLVGGARLALRIVAESAVPRADGKRRDVLVIGAGDAGALVVREMQKSRQMNMNPVGFLDDDPAKRGQILLGVPVIGALQDLSHVLDITHVDEVIIAIPTAPGKVVRLVSDVCRLKGIPFRTMPGIYELLGGKVSVSRLREVDITDLLRREPARIHEEWIGQALKDKRVLVTGAGGSIGRELCRQIARWNPASLVLLGHGENSIFEALLELKADYPYLKLDPVIADVRDHQRLDAVFAEHRPQVVFHAAAHKHVPLMEINVEEAVANNILGTQNVVETADRHRVERLVLISTDKAVHPANVYGATKRMAEMIVLDAARRTGNAFSVVRFGNVLGSRGSVVPLFKRMIAAGGPLTITHPDMERFFMTIPEAVHLVLQAAAMGEGGEAFLLNMGEQVRILNLAEDLIRLSGLEPGRDIEIVFTGIRPGEKLREELWEGGKTYDKTAHPDVFCSMSEDMADEETVCTALERFSVLVASSQPEAIIDLLDEVVPGSAIRANIRPKDVMDVV
ncbi:MAG: polysaccharide biosynthesis protein [Anaerolineae bacterium]|nr:polysaccharide biosynthesis protein [Anaerolineae bacterium]